MIWDLIINCGRTFLFGVLGVYPGEFFGRGCEGDEGIFSRGCRSWLLLGVGWGPI
jgi:hypothetical protein